MGYIEKIDPELETIKLNSFNSTELTLSKQEAKKFIMELDESVRGLERIGELKHAMDLQKILHPNAAKKLVTP